MIDFWEILGHAATDDAFRKNMYDTFAKSKASPNPDKTNTYACMYDNQDYANARKLVVAEMGPVSLMALGEWFVVSMRHPESRPVLDNIAGIVQGILKKYNSTNPVFYQTLGASIVDSAFSGVFNAGNEGDYGFKLSSNDRKALSPVIGDGGFQAQSTRFHAIDWDTGCKDMVIQSLGHPYAHALEVPFKP
jgi:hypothetical protein